MSSGKHFHNVLCLSEAKGMDIMMNDTFNGADVHDVGYFLRHGRLVRLLVGICQFVLDDVQSKEKLVLPDKFLVSLDIAGFADNNRLRE